MDVRRVVTGQTASGKSVVVSDERVGPITVGLLPGTEFHRVWGSDEPVKLPTAADTPAARSWFPPADGFRFGFFTLAPEGTEPPQDLDMGAAMAELEEKVPGLAGVVEPDNPAMHTTDTIDYVFIVSGEVYLELDDGAEVRLGAGDCVVQNGTRHAWHNRSSEPCVMALALVGAAR